MSDDYGSVIEAIDRLGSAVEGQRSVWVVATDLTADAAFDHVAGALASGDRLYVGTLARGNAWRNAICGSDALKGVLATGRA
ncbi:MAG: hypothetical protein ACYCXW_04115 [Solirubrobacteraceae bacterium]